MLFAVAKLYRVSSGTRYSMKSMSLELDASTSNKMQTATLGKLTSMLRTDSAGSKLPMPNANSCWKLTKMPLIFIRHLCRHLMQRYSGRNSAIYSLTSVNGNVVCQRTTVLLLPMSLITLTTAVPALLRKCKPLDLTHAIHVIHVSPTPTIRLMRGAHPTKHSPRLPAICAMATSLR